MNPKIEDGTPSAKCEQGFFLSAKPKLKENVKVKSARCQTANEARAQREMRATTPGRSNRTNDAMTALSGVIKLLEDSRLMLESLECANDVLATQQRVVPFASGQEI